MFSKIVTTKSTKHFSNPFASLQKLMAETDTIVIGAGAGLSAAAGLVYSGKRFTDNFADFIAKYKYTDMYTAAFTHYASPEEHWAYWSRHIFHNRLEPKLNEVYPNLLKLVAHKNYFVITTNVDHSFQRFGFDKERLFYTQGDYGLWQCSLPCHQETYDNEGVVRKMLAAQKHMNIPSELIPYCPKCQRPMSMNLRADYTFVEDSGWHAAKNRYEQFIQRYNTEKVLFLELGVGENTPVIIKYPFWKFTAENPKAHYVCLNLDHAYAPLDIIERGLCMEEDIAKTLQKLVDSEELYV